MAKPSEQTLADENQKGYDQGLKNGLEQGLFRGAMLLESRASQLWLNDKIEQAELVKRLAKDVRALTEGAKGGDDD